MARAETGTFIPQDRIASFEAVFVFLTLCLIAWYSGSQPTDWTSAAAVFLGFVYAQSSFEIAERDLQSRVSTETKRLRGIFMLKEVGWIVTFMLLGSWPLVFGAVMFLSYPYVRLLTRR
jgi:hypothetical protein